ncbi:MAG: radical SAM protein [Bradymonadaceae bacterium]|nr:radical SAM protein [Lujinxingiaceae bacterium]
MVDPRLTSLHARASIVNTAARIPCTQAEGPGSRFALWVQGCPLRCPGCCNPHMLEDRAAESVTVAALLAEIAEQANRIEGVTFLGGEPFFQAGALAELARGVQAMGQSVMVFSGHTLTRLRGADNADYDALLVHTDLLVDGPYLERLRVTDRRWIGSSNQRTHFLSERYRHLEQGPTSWDTGANTVELRLVGGTLTVNGFPEPGVLRLSGRRDVP